MEEVLRGLLSLVDGYVPAGERPHQEILVQAFAGVDNVRPPILSEPVHDALTDVKGFRHFERHNCRLRFDNTLVEENEVRAERPVPAFIRDAQTFISVMSGTPEDEATAGPG
nr:hypothetical protein [uncultured Rhodopila sp.]